MAFTKKDVAKIYVATFDRAPDAGGLDYWVNDSGFTDIEDVAKSFFDSPEAQEIYTSDKTSTQFVKIAYENLFNREPEEDGLAYWVDELDSGNISQSLMLQALINGALGDDKVIIDNKTEVGLSFAEAGLDDVELAKSIMEGITADYTSVQKATLEISSLKQDELVNPSHSEDISTLSNLDTLGVSSVYSGTKWDDSLQPITYSFNTTIPDDYYEYTENDHSSDALTDGWKPLNDEQKNATRDVFNKLEDYINIDFQEVSSDGLIELNKVNMESSTAGFSFYPGDYYAFDGDVFLSSEFDSQPDAYGLEAGEFGYSTIVHELGHALGLKHPFEAPNILPYELDDTNHSIMSYTTRNSYVPEISFPAGTNKILMNYKELEPQFYSLYDIEALQAVYGANTSTNTGDDTYKIRYDDYKIQTIWDGGGVDTIDLSGTIGNSTIDLNSGTLNSADEYTLDDVIKIYQDEATSEGKSQYNDWIAQQITDLYNDGNLYTGKDNLGIVQGVVIENIITGSGDDKITDNEVDNIINTADGDDKIYLGHGGSDKVDGGDGEDTIYLDIQKDDIKNFSFDGYEYNLQSDSFEVTFNGIEKLTFSDGSIYTPDALV